MTASYEPARPTLDDIHDLRGRDEIEAYREWSQEMDLDPWALSTFDLWIAGRADAAEAPDDSHFCREEGRR